MSNTPQNPNPAEGQSAGAHGEGTQRFREASEQITQKAAHMREDLADIQSAAKDLAQEQIEHLRGAASEYLDQGREKARELSETLEHRIREQPVRSVMMAAGAGVVLGLLFARR